MDYNTVNFRQFAQESKLLSPHAPLNFSFKSLKLPPSSRSVFDRLYSDSAIRQQYSNLKEGMSRSQGSKPSSREKIEDKLMQRHEASKFRLMRLKALKEAEVQSTMQQAPSINPLSRELAKKFHIKGNVHANSASALISPHSAVSPQLTYRKVKRVVPPRLVVKLEEDDSDEDQELQPGMSAPHTPLESVIEADYEEDDQPQLGKIPSIARDKIKQLKRTFMKKDCLLEPDDPMEFIPKDYTSDSTSNENTEYTTRPEMMQAKSHVPHIISYEDALWYKQIVDDRRRMLDFEAAKPRHHQGAFSRVL